MLSCWMNSCRDEKSMKRADLAPLHKQSCLKAAGNGTENLHGELISDSCCSETMTRLDKNQSHKKRVFADNSIRSQALSCKN